MSESPFGLYSDDQLVTGITNALAESNLEAVEAILLVLAGQNPKRAQEVYDTMLVGVLIASERAVLRNPGSSPQWIDSEAFEGPVEVEPWERNPGSSDATAD